MEKDQLDKCFEILNDLTETIVDPKGKPFLKTALSSHLRSSMDKKISLAEAESVVELWRTEGQMGPLQQFKEHSTLFTYGGHAHLF